MIFGLNVSYTLQPGKRQQYLEALAAINIPAAVLAEEGCLQYQYYLDAVDPDKLLLVEQWVDREAQQVHMTQPHMAQAMELKDEFVQDVTLLTYDIQE